MDKELENRELGAAEVVSWDADVWKVKYETYRQRHQLGNMRKMNADVFQNTVKIARAGSYLIEGKKVCKLSSEKIVKMQEGTRFYSEEFYVSAIPSREEETVVKVESEDCLNVALRLKSEGYNVAVLNLADQFTPGGGVIYGSRAQEEGLFRRTNLFQSLYQFVANGEDFGVTVSKEHRYPMDGNFGGVYTPNAFVFRCPGVDGYRLIEPIEMSFIAVAAIDSPDLTEDRMIVDGLVGQTKNKIRTIYRIGLDNGHDTLVLGAFGCGAFANPPEHMAKLFREVMNEPEFKNKFRLFDFAILEDHNSTRKYFHNPNGNFKPFQDVFGS